MTVDGADVPALRNFASALETRRHDLTATGRRLAALVDDLRWAGPDRDRFVEEWHRRHGPALAEIADDLSRAAVEARHHADRQQRASATRR